MDEKLTHSGVEHLADTIESRVLLGLSTYIQEHPDLITKEAQTHLENEALPAEVILEIDLYREQEQRKAIKLSRTKLTHNIAVLVLAHVWQDENDKARQQHRRLPH